MAVALIPFIILLIVGCDNGSIYGVPPIVTVKVTVEREQPGANASFVVFAKSMERKTNSSFADTLAFDCPCYLGDEYKIVSLFDVGTKLKMVLLPYANYDVKVEYVNVDE